MTDKQNLTDKPETTTPEVSTVEALTKQTEALKELTAQVSKLCAEWAKWRVAGKFSFSFLLTSLIGYCTII